MQYVFSNNVKSCIYFLNFYALLRNVIFSFFNSCRLSKARQTIECAFGILANRFQILQNKMAFKLKTSIAVVQALVCPHNFIITRELESEEEYREYFPERLTEQFIRENRDAENRCDIFGDEIPLNDVDYDYDFEEPIFNDDIDESALRTLLTNYFENH